MLILLSAKVRENNLDENEYLLIQGERFSHLIASLKSYLELWLNFNGLQSKVSQLDKIETRDTAWSIAITKYISQSQDILHVSKNEQSITTISLDQNDDVYKQWADAVEEMFQLCRIENLYTLAALVALLHSKFVLITTGYHEVALKWAKYAIAATKPENCSSPPPQSSASASASAAVSSSTARVSCVDTTPIEMEGMLLIAELHEATGSLDRCVSYLAEAKALSLWSASAIQKSIYSLHAFRIWYRVNSKKISNEFVSITSCYDELHNVSQDPYTIAVSEVGKGGGGSEVVKNFMYDHINDSMSYLASQIQMRGVVTLPGFANMKKAKEVSSNTLEFRFLNHQWSFRGVGSSASAAGQASSSAQTTQEETISHSSPARAFVHLQQEFHYPLSHNTLTYLQSTLSSDVTSSSSSSSSSPIPPTVYFSGLSNINSIEPFKQHLHTKINGKPVTQGASFDILRSLRRRFSLDCLSGALGRQQSQGGSAGSGLTGLKAAKRKASAPCADTVCMLKSMYAFSLGAASCGTSVESSLENRSDMGKDRSSQLSSACVLVQSICLGDDEKLRRLMTLLDNSSSPGLGSGSGSGSEIADGKASTAAGSRRPMVTCFMTLEHSSRQVIIGRKDATVPFPFVLAVPCYDAIIACLEEWERVLEMNSSQLARTKDAVDVKSWSNEEKGAWWRDRDVLDERIQAYMRGVQDALGVWRCLLVPACVHGSRFSDDIDSQIRSNICTFARSFGTKLKPETTKKSAKNMNTKQSASMSVTGSGDDGALFAAGGDGDGGGDANAKITVLMYWIYFISECGVLTSDEQIEVFHHVIRHFLVAGGAVTAGAEAEAEAEIKNEATEIWEMLFSFKNKDKEDKNQSNSDVIQDNSVQVVSAPATVMAVEEEEECGGHDVDTERKRLERLKVPELRKLLKANQQDSSGKKSELVDRMCGFYAEKHAPVSAAPTATVTPSTEAPASTATPTASRGNHVVLILDELLQCIPFENMPLLRHKEVSRVPGLTVLVNLLLLHTQTQTQTSPPEQKQKQKQAQAIASSSSSSSSSTSGDKMLSLAHCWYSIDPDANLLGTRATMKQFMQPYAAKWGWTGFVGEKPPSCSIK